MSLGRSLSLSRHKRQATSQSTDPLPSEVVIERFTSWKDVTKQLSSYFEGVVDIEASYAKSYLKLANVIETPFKPGNQFLEKGGIQDIYNTLRDKTQIIAEQHANFAKTVDSNIVKQVHKIREDIKTHIKDIQDDTGKLAATVQKDRDNSSKAINELATAISNMNLPNHVIHVKNDPYIVNSHVRHQMQKQIHDENLHQKSAVIMQANAEKFEAEVVKSIQGVWATFGELHSKKSQSVIELQSALVLAFKTLDPTAEWLDFKQRRKDTLINPDAPLRNEEVIQWPQMEDPSTQPIHKGSMQRKKRYTRSYKEAFYVLTPAGYLHEYPSSDPSTTFNPEFSLYLPSCTLGPQSSDSAKSSKFNIEEGKHSGTGSSKGFRGTLGIKSEHAWSFKAENRAEMQKFWESIKPLCNRHLQAIETGAAAKAGVKAAVVGAGIQESPVAEEEEPADDAASSSGGSYQGSEPPGYGWSTGTDPGFAGVGAGGHDKKVSQDQGEAITTDAPAAEHVNKEKSTEEAPLPTGHPKEKSESTDSKFKEQI